VLRWKVPGESLHDPGIALLENRMKGALMLASIKAFFVDLAGSLHQKERFEEDDYRLAAAALMVHVVSVDGVVTPRERGRLHQVLMDRFGLDEAGTRELVTEATEMEGEAVDLYSFTSRLMRSLDEQGRKRIVEMLWEMTYADGQMNEIEDSVVWRAADLLGVSGRDRVELRQEAARNANAPSPGPE